MLWNAHKTKVIHHDLDTELSDNSDRQLKVLFISDIHRRKIKPHLLRKVKEEIDLVIIGGDLAEKNVPLSRVEKNVQLLSTLGPLYFVWGNNDREVGELAIRGIISRAKGVILENENAFIPGHPAWGICGTDDPSNDNVRLDLAFRNRERYKKTIFVSHQPSVWSLAEFYFEPTIMLAGHTHGGQIRIGKYGIAQKGFFMKFCGRGRLLSNGFGTTKLPLRLGAQPACHIITLSYKK